MTDKEKAIEYYLKTYLQAKRKVDEAIEMYGRVYSTCTSTHIYYGGGSSRTRGDVVGNSVCMLDEAQEKIMEKLEEAEAIREHIINLCKFIKSDLTRKTIKLIYLEGMSRRDVAEALDITPDKVTYHKTKGIKEIARYCE